MRCVIYLRSVMKFAMSSGAEMLRETPGWLVIFGSPGRQFTTGLVVSAPSGNEARQKAEGVYGSHPVLLVWKLDQSHLDRFPYDRPASNGSFVRMDPRQLSLGELQQIEIGGEAPALVGAHTRPRDGRHRHPREIGAALGLVL